MKHALYSQTKHCRKTPNEFYFLCWCISCWNKKFGWVHIEGFVFFLLSSQEPFVYITVCQNHQQLLVDRRKKTFAMNEFQPLPLQTIHGWERKSWIMNYECYHNIRRTDEPWFATCNDSERGAFWFTTLAFISMHFAKISYQIAFKVQQFTSGWSTGQGPFTYRIFCTFKFIISNEDSLILSRCGHTASR